MKHKPASKLFNHGERTSGRAGERASGRAGEGSEPRETRGSERRSREGHSCLLSRARLSRDFSQLPQMESLLTYRQTNESLTRSLSIELDLLGQEI